MGNIHTTNKPTMSWWRRLIYALLLLTMLGGLYVTITYRVPSAPITASDIGDGNGAVRRDTTEITADGISFIWLGSEFPIQIIQPQYSGIIKTRFWVHPSVTHAEFQYGSRVVDVSRMQSPRWMYVFVDESAIDGVLHLTFIQRATNNALQDAQLPIAWAFSELEWVAVGDWTHGAWLIAAWLVLMLGLACMPYSHDWIQVVRWVLWAGVVYAMTWVVPMHAIYWWMCAIFGVGAVSILLGFSRIRPVIWMAGLACVLIVGLDVVQASTIWYIIGLLGWCSGVVLWLRQQSPVVLHDIPTIDRGYRADIDGLRAIAVLTVIVFHAFPEVLQSGFIGVDMFFVLSGYLITHIVIAEVWRDRFSIGEFYQRRIRRIFPALTVVIVVVMLAFWFILFRDEYELLMQTIVASIGFVANIFYYLQVDYFAPETYTQPLVHLWSLGVEEQFYIFWPLLIVAMRGRRTALLASFVVVVVTSFITNIWLTTTDEAAAFYLPVSRFWELAMGGIVAWVSVFTPVTREDRYQPLQSGLSIGGVVLLLTGFWLIDAQKTFPGYWALLPVLGTAGLLCAHPTHRLQRWLSHPYIVHIGLISYPLYLWHWPVLVFSYLIYDGESHAVMTILLVVLSVVLAHVTYRLVERPIRFTARHRIQVRWLILTMGSVFALATLLWYIPVPTRVAHFLGRYDMVGDWIIRGELAQYSRRIDATECRTILGSAEYCRTSDTATGSEYVLIGDSHARSLYNGLFRDEPVQNNSYVVVADGCLPILNTDTYIDTRLRYYCQPPAGQTRQLQQLEQLKTDAPRYVFLIGRYSIVQGEDLLLRTHNIMHLRERDSQAELSVASSTVALANGLDAMLEQLTTDPRNRVVFVHQMPEFSFVPRNCMRTLVNQIGWACGIDRTRIEAHFAPYRAAVAPVLARYPQVSVFDPLDAFCDDLQCYSVLDGELLFYDQDHLNIRGARRVMELIQSRFP